MCDRDQAARPWLAPRVQMGDRDPKGLYQALQVEPTATAAEVKQAYRKRALVCHPDKNLDDPEATDLFQRVSGAYQILSNDEKRARYDQCGAVDSEDECEGDVEEMMAVFAHIFGDFLEGGPMFEQRAPRRRRKASGRGRGTRAGARRAARMGRGSPMGAGVDMMMFPEEAELLFGGGPMVDDLPPEQMFEELFGIGGGARGPKRKSKGKKKKGAEKMEIPPELVYALKDLGLDPDNMSEEEILEVLETMGGLDDAGLFDDVPSEADIINMMMMGGMPPMGGIPPMGAPAGGARKPKKARGRGRR